jgi:hypothetical protein
VQSDGLVVGDISPPFALAGQELGVKAPGDNGLDERVVCIICVVGWRGREEVALAGRAGTFSVFVSLLRP